MKTAPLYEAHFALPHLPESAEAMLMSAFEANVSKVRYFRNIINIVDERQPTHIDPKSHDIDDAMCVTTKVFWTREAAIRTIQACINTLQSQGITGWNFELEMALDQSCGTQPTIEDFSACVGQKNPPSFEVHVAWRGIEIELPSSEIIKGIHERIFAYPPHQMVDLAEARWPTGDETIRRITTVYLPSQEVAMAYWNKAKSEFSTLWGAQNITAEKICVVGEPVDHSKRQQK